MKILLDSHVFVWFVLGDKRCGPYVRGLIDQRDAEAYVSAATAWELATKVRFGKWPEASAIVDRLDVIVRMHDFTSLPVTLEHGRVAGLFESAHKDPFDRMMAAQAQAENIPLITADPAFQSFPIETIWKA